MLHAAELNAIFAHWCAQQPLAVVLQAFEAAGGTIAPVYGIDQIAADPQIVARQAICEVAAILGDALVRLLFPNPAVRQVDFAETESPHGTAPLTP